MVDVWPLIEQNIDQYGVHLHFEHHKLSKGYTIE